MSAFKREEGHISVCFECCSCLTLRFMKYEFKDAFQLEVVHFLFLTFRFTKHEFNGTFNCFGSGSFFMFTFMEHGFRSAFYTTNVHILYILNVVYILR